MSSRNVDVKLTANTLQYQKAMHDAGTSTTGVATTTTKATSDVGSKWGKLGSSIQGSMGLSYAAVGAAAVGAAAYAIGAASSLEESINAVNVSYGESAEAVHQLGTKATDMFGLSTRAFNDTAVSFTNFAEDVAGDGGNVAGTLQDLMLRSTDFASVMNIDVTNAASAFKSALSGEAEPLKAFGINISDAAVKAYALESGLIAVGETMTDQEKVQARYGLLMKETEKVAGDFANTSDGYANSMKKAKAELENLAASFGKILIPALAEGLTTVTDLIGAWNDLASSPVVKLIVDFQMPGADNSFFSDLIAGAERELNPVKKAQFIFEGYKKAIDDVTGSATAAIGPFKEYGGATAEIEAAIAAARGEQEAMNRTNADLASSSYLVQASIDAAVEALDRQTSAADLAREANRSLADGTYDLYDAESALYSSVEAANTILGDSEASLFDVRGALADVAIKTDEYITKQLELDGTNVDTVAGQQLWNEKMLESAATLAGPMQAEVLAHIGRVNGIPSEKITAILADADPNNLAQIEREIDAVADKPRTATINIKPGTIPRANYGSDGWITGFNARGTNNWKGGMTWVGEEGPELMNLPPGTKIFPHDKSMAMASSGSYTSTGGAMQRSAGGASFPSSLTFLIEGNPYRAILADHDRAMVAELMAGVR